ncbi:MAG: glycosyltransferase family 39 protein [Candidatus Saccharibacteria bacterium]|nr:glycosyltransferase family 39 protein [Candidatus Saccharibacteria bacterium]
MKKIVISKLFLYRYRFIIGYTLLGLAFVALLFVLPIISQHGLSEAEINSTTGSYYLGWDAIKNGDLIDLPYRLLQKISITIFGLSTYAVKLPSIIVGLGLGLLLVLLLNRWFKSNVSLLASCLVVLSTPFLFLAGSGTPLIMLIFWPTLLLWLGSKIQGEKKPKPSYCFLFALTLLLAVFTPYMVYFAIFCVFFVFLQPHLRFIIKSLPKLPLIIVGLIVAGGMATLIASIIMHPDTIMGLLFAKTYDISNFLNNIVSGFTPIFAWQGAVQSVFLAPLISLPTLALALVGLFSTTKGFFASRNSIASLLIVFAIIITGFNPDAALFIILPLSILVAHGLKYLLEKWYGLFPENPYARIVAIFPLAILFGVMLVPSLLQYIYGYRYNPGVARKFDYCLTIVRENLTDETLVAKKYYDFYKILEDSTDLKVINEIPTNKVGALAVLHDTEKPENYILSRIITSPMAEDSDIIYLYTEKGE